MNGRNTGLSLLLAALLAAGTLTGCGAAREQLTGQVEKIAGQVIGGQKEEAEEAEEQENQSLEEEGSEKEGSEKEGSEREDSENSERGAEGQVKGADAGSQDTGAVANGREDMGSDAGDGQNRDSEADGLDNFSYEDLKGWKFIFSSGAGAWSTDFQIYGDGTFEGIFQDSDMGDTGPGYPNGTVYYSEFNGRFTEPRKVDDNTYVFQVDSINYPLGFGDEIKDGCYYAYREAYGLDGAEDLYLYLPGSRLADLPEDFLNWVGYHNLSGTEETELPFYGIYNEKEGSGISSYYDEDSVNGFGSDGAAGQSGAAEVNLGAGTGAGTGSGFGQSAGTGAVSGAEMGATSDGAARIQAEIARAEEAAARLEEEMHSARNQAEMTQLSGEIYTVWDDALNAIWKILKENLDEASMEQLTVEERQWIKDKEAAAEAAGAEFAGGTVQSMMISSTAAELTRTRVYELAEYLR